MRIVLAASILAVGVSGAVAQQTTQEKKDFSDYGTGRTIVPDDKGVMQPQGPTGPSMTEGRGGAPARSPQGETPPGMQSAPEGSSKTIVEPAK